MKKSFKMENLDCANCAAKMEEAIGKLDGVESVSISFMMQKMKLVAEDSKIDDILDKADEICKKLEPDCTIIR